ncbi:MAG: hypothetical protein HQK77_16245 [Desulfobacterales bacterium]|nr:hypothetical protein [Desulfobacterales bacterium]
MESIRIESNPITFPLEVFKKLQGKEIEFFELQDGFLIKPVSIPLKPNRKFSKLEKLKHRQLLKCDPDELVMIKVDEWNESHNL